MAPVTADSGFDPELSFAELGLEWTSLCSPVVSFGDSGLDSSTFVAVLTSPAILSFACVGVDFESSVTFSLADVGLESSAKDCDSCLLGSKADDGLDPLMLSFPDVGLESSDASDFAETGLDPVLLSLAVVGLDPSVLDLTDIGLKSSWLASFADDGLDPVMLPLADLGLESLMRELAECGPDPSSFVFSSMPEDGREDVPSFVADNGLGSPFPLSDAGGSIGFWSIALSSNPSVVFEEDGLELCSFVFTVSGPD